MEMARDSRSRKMGMKLENTSFRMEKRIEIAETLRGKSEYLGVVQSSSKVIMSVFSSGSAGFKTTLCFCS